MQSFHMDQIFKQATPSGPIYWGDHLDPPKGFIKQIAQITSLQELKLSIFMTRAGNFCWPRGLRIEEDEWEGLMTLPNLRLVEVLGGIPDDTEVPIKMRSIQKNCLVFK